MSDINDTFNRYEAFPYLEAMRPRDMSWPEYGGIRQIGNSPFEDQFMGPRGFQLMDWRPDFPSFNDFYRNTVPQEITMRVYTPTKEMTMPSAITEKIEAKKKEIEALQREAVKEKVIEFNNKFRPIETKKASAKAREIGALIDKLDFGCKRSSVAQLMAAVIGESIPTVADKNQGLQGIVVVVTKQPVGGAHEVSGEYPLNVPVMVTSTDYGQVLWKAGDREKVKSTLFRQGLIDDKGFRLATAKEVEKFLGGLSDGGLDYISRNINLGN